MSDFRRGNKSAFGVTPVRRESTEDLWRSQSICPGDTWNASQTFFKKTLAAGNKSAVSSVYSIWPLAKVFHDFS
jgi:hypothetical protein